MDTAYLHIVTNHLPIIGIPFATAILLIGIWKNSDDLKSGALLSFFVLGIAGIVVYLTGEPAEEVVEHLPGVAENAIEAHEDFAVYALVSMLVTGFASGIAFVLFKGWRLFIRGAAAATYPVWVAPIVLILALLSSGLLTYTGKLGGMIRHTEFYGAAQTSGESDEGESRRGRSHEDDDDDE